MQFLDGLHIAHPIDADLPQKTQEEVFLQLFVLDEILECAHRVDYFGCDILLVNLIEEYAKDGEELTVDSLHLDVLEAELEH